VRLAIVCNAIADLNIDVEMNLSPSKTALLFLIGAFVAKENEEQRNQLFSEMVKFGGHVEAIRHNELENANLYLIPYNKMKYGMLDSPVATEGGEVESDAGPSDACFVDIWNQSLDNAEEDFRKARRQIWQRIFSSISEHDKAGVRGAHPGNAIMLYVELAKNPGEVQELLVRMKQVYRAALTNSEGLRKIVKKYDKRKDTQLSSELLPLLFTSSLYAGQKMLEDSIGLLRDLLSKDEVSEQFQPLIKSNSEYRHQESIEARMKEVDWLKRLVASIPQEDLLPHLVAHRGFHNIKDRNDKRPIENSLSAYEIAWTSGIHLCECDIALTKDEKLVLAHDDNFKRLVLDATDENSTKRVRDLTFKELISMPLLSGVRPPLLIDVLRSASAISDESKLVIEIKPGNDMSAFALARLLSRHHDLLSSVAVIMSFDASTMHRFRAELNLRVGITPSVANQQAMPPMQHRRVTSYDHFGSLGAMLGGSHPRLHSPSIDFSNSIGLSISQTNLNGHLLNNFDAPHLSPIASVNNPSMSLLQAQRQLPKLMLLAVAHPPHIPCELEVHTHELHRVDSWLSTNEGSLDGVYLQYEESMMTPEGAAHLKELSRRYLVGVWGYSGRDPDDFKTFEWLVKEANCAFVNTDLPKQFRMELLDQDEPCADD
jgi:glycerophosphoryl diester phosphodiesterase